ncbi:MAG: carbon starvation protein A, partial [Planctomycetota bacterium]|nr:carbon starvation protein A [Planctomycetota bacterium]
MTILPVVAVCAVVLVIAYFTYGRLVVRWLGLDPTRVTPAVEYEDGNDYVPASAPVVLGGHFTAIAAAGPVVGPILAGLAFGWVPALAWILVGAIFVGGVHDAGALLASIRHRASSITQVVREHMSRTAYLTFLLFVWISLIYVIIAF